MLYAWSGLYLIETGVPVSWSTLDYPSSALVYLGEIKYHDNGPKTSVHLYKPWLDEPPLFSLLVGYFAHINHASRTEFIPSTYIRIPMIFIGALTGIMVFLIARAISGYWMGILAMLLFGTIPVFVFASRSAMPENLISLIFTVIVYLTLKFDVKQKLRYILPIPLLIGVAGLSKPTGFFLALFPAFIFFKIYLDKRRINSAIKTAAYILVGTLVFVGIFIAYGMHFSPEIFWHITSIQSYRPAGFSSLAWFFVSPAYKTTFLLDSWYVFCLLSVGYFIFLRAASWRKVDWDKQLIILMAFIFWIGVVMISAGETDLLPWYRFPAFPFLAIIGSWGVRLLIKNTNLLTSFLAVGFFLGNRTLLVNAFRPNISPVAYRQVIAILMLPSAFNFLFHNPKLEKLARYIIIGLVIVGIYINSAYIYSEYQLVCENVACPVVPTSRLSTLYFPIFWRFFDFGQR